MGFKCLNCLLSKISVVEKPWTAGGPGVCDGSALEVLWFVLFQGSRYAKLHSLRGLCLLPVLAQCRI